MEIEQPLDSKWETYYNEHCSSPSRPESESLIKGIKIQLTKAELAKQELALIKQRRMEEQETKLGKLKVLKKFGAGGLTSRDAQRLLEERARKAAQEAQWKQER
jgi:hypothetical protein